MSSKTQPTVYDQLIALRNRQRTLQAESPFVIRGADVSWETNPQGIIKWYLHPAMERSCHKALIFSVQKIPPESRSGKQHCQGGVVQYVVQGKGRTVMNEISHPWETGDVVQLPLLPEGVTFQHFNETKRSEEHTSELQSRGHLVCRLLLEKKKKNKIEEKKKA